MLFKETDGNQQLIISHSMQSQIIRQVHEKSFSASKTEQLIKRYYWIQNLKTKVEKIVRNCVSWTLAKRKRGKKGRIISRKRRRHLVFIMDHFGPLPSHKNYRHVLVVIDAFTQIYVALRNEDDYSRGAGLSKETVIFGNSRKIISDRGSAFSWARLVSFKSTASQEEYSIFLLQ